MTPETLINQIKEKKSCLCVGLDTDFNKLPDSIKGDKNAIGSFNKHIIEATLPYAVAYKLNIAFYELLGSRGWDLLAETLSYIPKDIFIIADAKRGDIGNTSSYYAETFFHTYQFDAITVSPYMGEDSVAPFLNYANKWTFILGLTSNSGARDFQYLESEGKPLYQHVINKANVWSENRSGQLGFVVGATQGEALKSIRKWTGNKVLLVPGIGAQGGSITEVCSSLLMGYEGLLINSSRSILYASQGADFAEKAAKVALRFQREMNPFLD